MFLWWINISCIQIQETSAQGRVDYASVKVTVASANNFAPVITASSSQGYILENSAVSTLVSETATLSGLLKLTFSDQDVVSGIFLEFSYESGCKKRIKIDNFIHKSTSSNYYNSLLSGMSWSKVLKGCWTLVLLEESQCELTGFFFCAKVFTNTSNCVYQNILPKSDQ